MTRDDLFILLQKRYDTHPARHPGLSWDEVLTCLAKADDKTVAALLWMEETGGEPDVFGQVPASEKILFVDFAPESPAGRRSLCYDEAAWLARKANRPESSAMKLAEAYGVELLDEAGYRALQAVEPVDRKTSSWIKTPSDVRSQGGAIFGDNRYGRVFIYHNGADSYYGVRGFRVRCEV